MLKTNCIRESSNRKSSPSSPAHCTPARQARQNSRTAGTAANPVVTNIAATSEASPSHTWQKILWRKQAYPDNYTDGSFLKELVINADVPRRSYWKVVLGSLSISQQLSVAVASITIPTHLHRHSSSSPPHLPPHGSAHPHYLLLLAALVLTATGYSCGFLQPGSYRTSVVNAVDGAIKTSAGTYLAAPFLRLVARALGRDSLVACIVFLLLFHLYFYDYNFQVSTSESILGTAALSAAVLSSVLASTFLPDPITSVLYVLLATLMFLLSPYPRQALRRHSTPLHLLLSLLLAATSLLLLATLSVNLTTVLLLAQFFIVMLCPWWLVRIHKFKAKINGPWDEAVPRIPTALGHRRDGGH